MVPFPFATQYDLSFVPSVFIGIEKNTIATKNNTISIILNQSSIIVI